MAVHGAGSGGACIQLTRLPRLHGCCRCVWHHQSRRQIIPAPRVSITPLMTTQTACPKQQTKEEPYQAFVTPICPIFLPLFRLYGVFSLHVCVFPYKYCKMLEMLLKLMKLCCHTMILTPCPYGPTMGSQVYSSYG